MWATTSKATARTAAVTSVLAAARASLAPAPRRALMTLSLRNGPRRCARRARRSAAGRCLRRSARRLRQVEQLAALLVVEDPKPRAQRLEGFAQLSQARPHLGIAGSGRTEGREVTQDERALIPGLPERSADPRFRQREGRGPRPSP